MTIRKLNWISEAKMNNNLVYIGPLWGTPELKQSLAEERRGEIERLTVDRYDWATSVGAAMGDELVTTSPIRIIRKPTWTWCESPTDEMARKRPRCEVKLYGFQSWKPGVLLSVTKYTHPFLTDVDNHGIREVQSCRVRLDANGEVMVDWEGEE